jgi:hypothetical protein
MVLNPSNSNIFYQPLKILKFFFYQKKAGPTGWRYKTFAPPQPDLSASNPMVLNPSNSNIFYQPLKILKFFFYQKKAGPTGFEPATSGSTVRRSDPLNYGPIMTSSILENLCYCQSSLEP